MNTSEKIIEINGLTFADWDDLCGDYLKQFREKNGFAKNCDIHKRNEIGYNKGHKIQLVYGSKNIEDIVVGDVLKYGGCVYGLVQMNHEQFHLLTESGFITRDKCDYNGIIDLLS